MAEPVIHKHHRAIVVETCSIVMLGAFLLAAGSRFPLPQLVAGGLLAAACAAAAVYVVTQCGPLASVTGAWGLLVTGWLSYVDETRSLWHGGWQSLAAPGLVLTVVTLWVYSRYLTAGEIERQSADARRRRRELAKWHQALLDVGIKDVHAVSAEETRGGQAVKLRLPGSGAVTLSHLVARADNLAAAFRLQPGAVSFAQGAHAGEAIMFLDRGDTLAAPLLFPREITVLSVSDPLTFGVLPDGSPLTALLREVAMLISGATGAGKTNLMNVLIALLTMCNDVIVCVIDVGKQGRLAAPWIRPWVEGRCDHPAIDWVATTRGEAYDMLTGVNQMITARAASLIGGSKITPTPSMPQVVVITDEMADLFGMLGKAAPGEVSNENMAREGAAFTRKGRGEAAMAAWGTQRSTADFMGLTAIKSQCKLRFLLGTTSEVDARSATDSVAASKLLAQAQYPGSVIVEQPGMRQSVLGKLYRLDPAEPDDLAHIDRLAQLAGMTRPGFDDLSRAALGAAYVNRWERSELYQRMLADFHLRTGQAPLPPPRQSAAAVQEIDVAAEARTLLESIGLAGGKPDAKSRMYALLADMPVMGMSVFEIRGALQRDGLEPDRSTVYRWLEAGVKDGTIERLAGEGEGARFRLKPPPLD